MELKCNFFFLGQLKFCVKTRLLLRDNIDIVDIFLNSSIGTPAKLYFNPIFPLCGTIFVKFDNPKVGNSFKKMVY